MKRRNFIESGALIAASGVTGESLINNNSQSAPHEYYEMRRYELTFGSNHSALYDYLKQILIPAHRSLGASNAAVFTEVGDAEPTKIWLMTAFRDLASYEKSVQLANDKGFLEQSAQYANAGKMYNRYSSFLLRAFDGMKQMVAPEDINSLFELRIYEGYNEDAVRRKIKMFDVEEISLFHKVGLTPVLFGNMLIGPHMPSLVYMLSFPDMAERDAAWTRFLQHPDWNEMKAKPEYADTVSNIRKIFLRLHI